MTRRYIHPAVVPIKVLSVLARNGIEDTKLVHSYIHSGKLRLLQGVGPAMEAKIIRCYTEMTGDRLQSSP